MSALAEALSSDTPRPAPRASDMPDCPICADSLVAGAGPWERGRPGGPSLATERHADPIAEQSRQASPQAAELSRLLSVRALPQRVPARCGSETTSCDNAGLLQCSALLPGSGIFEAIFEAARPLSAE